jgi:hypothetical protein
MKFSRLIVSFVAALATVMTLGAHPSSAQSLRVHPNRLNSLIPRRGLRRHRSALGANAHDAIVTEDGPLKGVEIWGGDGYFGIPYATRPRILSQSSIGQNLENRQEISGGVRFFGSAFLLSDRR